MKDRLLPFAISFVVTCLFFINVCDWIFDCGCHSLWAGADALCNVHLANIHHCPFCSRGIAGYTVVMTAVSAPQLAASVWLPSSRVARIGAVCCCFRWGWLRSDSVAGTLDGYWG